MMITKGLLYHEGPRRKHEVPQRDTSYVLVKTRQESIGNFVLLHASFVDLRKIKTWSKMELNCRRRPEISEKDCGTGWGCRFDNPHRRNNTRKWDQETNSRRNVYLCLDLQGFAVNMFYADRGNSSRDATGVFMTVKFMDQDGWRENITKYG